MNTIADIDDARLGRMMKGLLVRTEKEGGSLNIGRTSRSLPAAPGTEPQELPQHWTVAALTYDENNPYAQMQATLSHADLAELLERLAVATR